MIVISDTSPISNLLKVNKLNLLQQLYGEVYIPQAVKKELLAIKSKSALELLENTVWLIEAKPSVILNSENITPRLHIGELEAISLASELKADWLLIDEKAGRIFAKQKGIKTIGLIGVLIEAKRKGFISKVTEIVDELIEVGGFWISEEFYNEIKQLTNE